MTKYALGTALVALCLSFGCSSSTDKVRELEQQVADKDKQIKELKKAGADKDDEIKVLTERLRSPSRASSLREVKWSKILENATKMQKEDGKYEWFYVVLEKADAESANDVREAAKEKGYEVASTRWDGILKVTSPKEVSIVSVMLVTKIPTVVNTKPLNDNELAEVTAIPGVKSVWPASAVFFPVTFGKDIPGNKLHVDVKVIGLPPEFFEAESDKLDLVDFNVYDGKGAHVIVPRVFVEYFIRSFRYTDGYKLEYEKSLHEEPFRYYKVRLASSSLFAITPDVREEIDVKVMGCTDLIDDMTIIVIPAVVEDWNKRLFEKK
jgi:hypothetical protein